MVVRYFQYLTTFVLKNRKGFFVNSRKMNFSKTKNWQKQVKGLSKKDYVSIFYLTFCLKHSKIFNDQTVKIRI